MHTGYRATNARDRSATVIRALLLIPPPAQEAQDGDRDRERRGRHERPELDRVRPVQDGGSDHERDHPDERPRDQDREALGAGREPQRLKLGVESAAGSSIRR